jgi:hypothetical protein
MYGYGLDPRYGSVAVNYVTIVTTVDSNGNSSTIQFIIQSLLFKQEQMFHWS